MVIASMDKARELGLKPWAKLVANAVSGVEPHLMGCGPVPAVKRLLAKTELTLDAIDLIELNEAFAAQYLACETGLELDRNIVNVNGSGIALGHPVGCTGARITLSLIDEMKRREAHYGIGALCVGGGMGASVLVENIL